MIASAKKRTAPRKRLVRRKPGRPVEFGERHALGLRVTKETKEALDRAAQASGRSLSQEAETRLESTFTAGNAVFDALDLAYGPRWVGLLLAIATLAQIIGTRGVFLSQWKLDGGGDWLADPYAYDQAVQGTNFVLEAFRPEGKIAAPLPPDNLGFPQSAYQRLGEGFARELLDGLVNPANKGPAWAFADRAGAIRDRLARALPTIQVPPDVPIR